MNGYHEIISVPEQPMPEKLKIVFSSGSFGLMYRTFRIYHNGVIKSLYKAFLTYNLRRAVRLYD